MKAAGLTEQKAETITDLQKETVQSTLNQARHDYQLDDLSTKRDLRELEFALKRDVKEMETALKHDFKELELKFDAKLAETKSELIRWIVSVGLLQTALITALLLKLIAV